ncbi:MAG: group II intron reverse transcriptase/maturase [Bacteroidota bacterium]
MIDYYEIKSQPITRVMVLQAYKKVRANKGSGGVDDMDWEWLDNNLKTELYKLWNRLTSGSYFPMPVKEVPIKKKGGGERKLGIPTLLDRIAQQVAKTHLERILDPHFHNSSFGYRPARNCHQAVAQANKNTYDHDFVIDMDIKGFFDNIDHDLLMKAVRFYCQDKWILLYVERWLKAGIVQQDSTYIDRLTGTPQGGVISPLLANLFLHVGFDKWMEINHPEKPFERYADDVVVHCKTEKQAIFMLKQIGVRLQKCKLTLHPVKTKIVNVRGRSEKKYPKSYDFLGFTIRPHWVKVNGKMMLMPSMFMSRKSKNSVVEKFKELNIHKRRKPLEVIASELRPIIQGIINYYCKFSSNHTREIWNQLNARLLKWVKWEKGLYKMASLRWLKKKYKETPLLFPHWKLVNP